MNKTLWTMVVICLAAVLALPACGDDDDSTATDTGTGTGDTGSATGDTGSDTTGDTGSATEADGTVPEAGDCKVLIAKVTEQGIPVRADGLCAKPDAVCAGGFAGTDNGISTDYAEPRGDCAEGLECCMGVDQCAALSGMAAIVNAESKCQADACGTEALLGVKGGCPDAGYCCVVPLPSTDTDTASAK